MTSAQRLRQPEESRKTTEKAWWKSARAGKEGSELRHKLIPLTVKSVVAEVSQRRWVCQKVSFSLGTHA